MRAGIVRPAGTREVSERVGLERRDHFGVIEGQLVRTVSGAGCGLRYLDRSDGQLLSTVSEAGFGSARSSRKRWPSGAASKSRSSAST